MLNDAEHLAPLRFGKIRARRVVAGRVQQHEGALRQLSERIHHGAEIHAAGGARRSTGYRSSLIPEPVSSGT